MMNPVAAPWGNLSPRFLHHTTALAKFNGFGGACRNGAVGGPERADVWEADRVRLVGSGAGWRVGSERAGVSGAERVRPPLGMPGEAGWTRTIRRGTMAPISAAVTPIWRYTAPRAPFRRLLRQFGVTRCRGHRFGGSNANLALHSAAGTISAALTPNWRYTAPQAPLRRLYPPNWRYTAPRPISAAEEPIWRYAA